jgi:hypothetical protein
MRYFYVDQLNRPAGPVDATALCEALLSGVLTADSLIAEEYTDVWQPIGSLLPFYYSGNGETCGPACLSEIHEVARSSPAPILICPLGGSSWHPLPGTSLTTARPALPVVAASPVYAAPRAMPQPAVPAEPRRLRSAVTTAGIIWIAAGGGKILDTLIAAVIGATHLIRIHVEPVVIVVSVAAFLVSMLIGIAFLLTGLGTVRGRPGNLVRRGVYSLAAGLISLIVALRDAQTLPEGKPGQFDSLLTATATILSVLLIVAGIIALSHHRNPWRKSRQVSAP